MRISSEGKGRGGIGTAASFWPWITEGRVRGSSTYDTKRSRSRLWNHVNMKAPSIVQE